MRTTPPPRHNQPPRRNQAEPRRGQQASSRRIGQQAVVPTRVRQASVPAASLTAAERASLRALGPANRTSARLRVAPPQPAQSRAAPPRAAPPRAAQSRAAPRRAARSRAARDSRASAGPPALRRTTGIVLTASGAILWLAVHVTVAFVAIQRAGLVLLVTGLLWLWLPVPGKRDRLRRRFNQLMSFIEWDPASADSARCSLEDLLQPRSDASPDGSRYG
jgi:hypothetical protein